MCLEKKDSSPYEFPYRHSGSCRMPLSGGTLKATSKFLLLSSTYIKIRAKGYHSLKCKVHVYVHVALRYNSATINAGLSECVKASSILYMYVGTSMLY